MGNTSLSIVNSKIKSNQTKFLANKIGDEMVMMNMVTGDFVTLNKVGAEIWNLSIEPIKFTDLVIKLKDQFDISEEQCINETSQFLDDALNQGIFLMDNSINE